MMLWSIASAAGNKSDRVDHTLLRFLRAPALAPRVVFDLIALDLADAEIVALRVAEIEPAHRGARPHGEALGELHAGRGLAAEEIEQRCLPSVVRPSRSHGRNRDLR